MNLSRDGATRSRRSPSDFERRSGERDRAYPVVVRLSCINTLGAPPPPRPPDLSPVRRVGLHAAANGRCRAAATRSPRSYAIQRASPRTEIYKPIRRSTLPRKSDLAKPSAVRKSATDPRPRPRVFADALENIKARGRAFHSRRRQFQLLTHRAELSPEISRAYIADGIAAPRFCEGDLLPSSLARVIPQPFARCRSARVRRFHRRS